MKKYQIYTDLEEMKTNARILNEHLAIYADNATFLHYQFRTQLRNLQIYLSEREERVNYEDKALQTKNSPETSNQMV